MLGVPGLTDGAAEQPHESGGASSGEVDRSGGGNRWPRQETLALLRIRSDMDVAFKDSSLKGPLWEEVSRKMAELGFQRSAKKCKEKFENVYKYHKRTKDGRASKSDGKTYRFFDQLEALDHTPPPSFTPPPPPRPQPPPPMTMVAATLPMPTVPSTSPSPISVAPPIQTANASINAPPFQLSQPPQLQPQSTAAAANNPNPPQTHNFPPPHSSSLRSTSTSSSSTSSDEDIHMRRGKKRKWKDFFERLMKDVISKQEELQKKFLDTLEKRERDRLAREEAWKVQEMTRMNREHELLVHERSLAAAKDAAVISFLQKVTDQSSLQIPINNNTPPPPPMQPQNPNPQPPPQPSNLNLAPPPKPVTAAAPPPPPPAPTKAIEISRSDDNSISTSSSRWPKAEVQALINLRTSMDVKYQENGPKGPLWEEISAAMGKLGYNRSSKRCKEKWENINKYFKKVKESNRKRPDDSKTCPYFHQLEAIYKERAKGDPPAFNANDHMAPIMAQPEQQWPLPDQHNVAMRDQDHESDEDEDDEDDEDEGGEYEIVATKQPSNAAE